MAKFYIDPSPSNFHAFKDLPRDEPIHMLNLLRYRDLAEYPEGHEHHGNGWSGRRGGPASIPRSVRPCLMH